MRLPTAVLLSFIVAGARADAPRYGIAPDPKAYPQATPQEALASVLKAVEAKRFDYLAAQLADPTFVDDRVNRLFGGRFEMQVEETANQFSPAAAKLFGRFLKDGEWMTEKDTASVRLKDVKDRAVYFRRIGERWYLENRWKA
jgi:hypothetical protein